ncbi:MAG: mechanosensitive ion channel family protein, partial [Terracidiphilus sp.]
QEFVRLKLPHLIGVAIIAFILNWLLRLISARTIKAAEAHAATRGRAAQVKTLVGVIRTTGLAIIGAIVGLQFLDAVGVDLAPLLASAGIAGVAIGLAAQNLVKDVLNGTLILIEAQFSVGDTVTIAGITGKVEWMTLRKTTVRGGDGTLYVIPNSQITTVANASADFSVATVNVSVDFSVDPERAIALLKKVAMEVRTSPQYKEDFVDDPQILGVDSLRGSQMIIPVQLKTIATRQYAPMREFQRLVRNALEENHMLPGDPNRVFNSFADPETGVCPVPPSTAPVRQTTTQAAAKDPTTIKPVESNPFSGS